MDILKKALWTAAGFVLVAVCIGISIALIQHVNIVMVAVAFMAFLAAVPSYLTGQYLMGIWERRMSNDVKRAVKDINKQQRDTSWWY